ncbi:hypothetical protein C7B65_17625 [Phormidesmis priestleyi ULC007]|uniref:DUF5357 domain-containing protein n=1 Tax=Phormidesmis priestleyi ULC007 TaxID=1920490 RepID=A0A2T1DB67_9CYAN|nr:DUF5357 family protein [Phormidesmis priestleyi]PSB17729.1 hypothetical protein C7B65_17625 [Phormidesmis priestleyi ULC007]PZO48670.1 MAG: hypothetical protein DCF14_16165 [Phormidesmis priestleyi]
MTKFFENIQKRLKEIGWASWQTFIALSVFSVIVAGMTHSPVQTIIANFGWLFLLIGVWWFTYDSTVKKRLTFNGLFTGPWIVGAIVCLWLFGSWNGAPTPASFISWPPVSALIWSVPRFIKTDPDKKTPTYTVPTPAARQDIVLMLLSNLVISCWFQLHFLLQDWLVAYPSIRSDDFGRSAFVVALNPQSQPDIKGIDLLDAAEQSLKTRLEGKPWGDVERWLSPEQLNQEIPKLAADAHTKMPLLSESNLWDLRGRVLPDTQYTLELQAIWQGPSAKTEGYYITKACQITQGRKAGPPADFEVSSSAGSTTRSRAIGTVKCEAPSQPLPIPPQTPT